MKLNKCESKDNWNKHLDPDASFLQQWSWGEFKRNLGKEVIRLQLKQNSEIIAQLQAVVHRLGMGVKYAYLPRVKVGSQFGNFLDYFKREKFAFVRVEPKHLAVNLADYTTENIENRQPKNSLILGIQPDKEDLLEDMHSKTRYNIRLSYRKDVETKQQKDLEVFYQLYEETTDRADFSGHSREYFENMLQLDNVYQLTSFYEGQPLSSIILVATDTNLTYLHGASTREHSDRMATYQSQWEGIQLGQAIGCQFYDFWGIAPILDEESEDTDKSFGYIWPKDHDLSGVTRFKVRFNGEVVSYPQAQNIIFNSVKYKMYNLGRKIL